MAEDDQAALSVFHEIDGGTYRLSFYRLAKNASPVTIEMTTYAAQELADAIYDTLRQAGERA